MRAGPKDSTAQYGFRDGLYYLSEEQAQAILDLRLHRLTALEQSKLIEEYQEILDEIAELLAILASTERLLEVIRDELQDNPRSVRRRSPHRNRQQPSRSVG